MPAKPTSSKPEGAGTTASPRRSTPVLSQRETVLLGRINAGLSEERAGRLARLDALREDEALTPEEHAELLSLVDESEWLTVGRAEALVELAGLRGVSVSSLLRDLGLGSEANG